jgi:hypothetical protein
MNEKNVEKKPDDGNDDESEEEDDDDEDEDESDDGDDGDDDNDARIRVKLIYDFKGLEELSALHGRSCTTTFPKRQRH